MHSRAVWVVFNVICVLVAHSHGCCSHLDDLKLFLRICCRMLCWKEPLTIVASQNGLALVSRVLNSVRSGPVVFAECSFRSLKFLSAIESGWIFENLEKINCMTDMPIDFKTGSRLGRNNPRLVRQSIYSVLFRYNTSKRKIGQTIGRQNNDKSELSLWSGWFAHLQVATLWPNIVQWWFNWVC